MREIKQNILTVKEPAIICHQVNTLGVMGAGLALQIKTKWPNVFEVYHDSPPSLGDFQTIWAEYGIYVANLAGQSEISSRRRVTNYGALASALYELRENMKSCSDIGYQVYFPHGMGCGLAGGDWNVVRELIEFYFPDGIICKL